MKLHSRVFLESLRAFTLSLAPVLLETALIAAVTVARAQVVPLESINVTATRGPQPVEQLPFSIKTLSGDTLRALPAATLDDALRSVPGFSLFRRSDSLTANPTAQGVSLRGLGPSGASRTLVLLDGVPLNDPFGGWVTWSKIPRESLARAELVRGGGGTAWGNSALGGVVNLLTEPAEGRSARVVATAGDFDTLSSEIAVTQPVGNGAMQILGSLFGTGGFSLVAPERRGTIDQDASSHHQSLTGRWRMPVADQLQVTFTARVFNETRSNGTPYQQNASREAFESVQLDAQPSKTFAWNAVAYAQDETFSSTFSGVNATRDAETPASNQFGVPALARGAAWTGTWTHADDANTTAGLDARLVRGETRELFTFSGNDFTRLRVAGGKELLAGLFALHERPLLSPDLRLSMGVRLDEWRESDGHRRETDRATGAPLRMDLFPTRDGLEFSPSVGLVWKAAPGLRLRAAAQQAFRRPTLNELYRPFRVGNVITEANPALATETVTTGEVGAEFTQGAFVFGATAFWHDLHHAVGNVTVAKGPGTVEGFGFIPVGGVGRQRINLDRTRVRGVELSAGWHVAETLTFNADFLYDDATVQRAAVAPNLVGLRLAEVPKHTASLGATWRAPGGITLTPRLRWIGSQFDDDENTLRLAAVVIVDLSASYALRQGCEVFVTVENLGDARIETGRSVDGVVNTGMPRFVFGGFRGKW